MRSRVMPGSSPTMERRRAGEAIEEGGFADVGAADDRKDLPSRQTRLRRKNAFERRGLLRILKPRRRSSALDGATVVACVGGGREAVLDLRAARGRPRSSARGWAALSGAGACPRRMAFHLAWTLRFVFFDAFAVALDGFQSGSPMGNAADSGRREPGGHACPL